ncbi:DUF2514 family protein [Pseudomonas sp. LP_4_YM]|uniref:DUF2514 family protein n=1 Tax=Pseudomonas sp. LP_4_YM TaxID=2485135 RepID=UPI001048FEBF|nr:DUF2514 family protein [Pseudomonas sp. LP_4_YM]TCT93297.1 uncharacterized protein DUF2514 [Pseudomonas sp. LP_4_YM]
MSTLLRLMPPWGWLLLASIALLAVMYVRLDSAHTELNEVSGERDTAIARADSIANTLNLQRQLTKDIEQVSENAQVKTQQVTAAVAIANGLARSLQQQVDDLLASRERCPSAPPSGGKTRDDLAPLLADLRRSADERAGELAAALDRSRIAGQACEAAYEAARTSR